MSCANIIKSSHWPRIRCCLKIFYFKLWQPSCSMERNRCAHLGFFIDTVLVHVNPDIILLLQSNFWLKATKGLGRGVEN